MKKEDVLLVVCFLMILGTTVAKSAFGGAMDSSSIGVKSWMMASAVTGIADDSSAVHWNPAGLVFHEDQEKIWHAQTYAIVFVDAKMKFESKYGIKDESDTDTILPGFFISKKYDKWAFGFGMDYKINNKFNFMAGIKYNEHSTKAQGLDTGTDVAINVLIPSANDVDLYSFYSGVLYDYSEKVELGIGVCHTMGIERTYNSQKYDQDHWYLLPDLDGNSFG